MADKIQCYFFGTSYGEQVAGQPMGLSGFAIPDIGILYRSRYAGSLYECQYAGFLALLKFIDENRKSFGDCQFEILTDSAIIVYQVAHKKFISTDLQKYYRAVMAYRGKIDFLLSWVPRSENPAITGLGNLVSYKSDVDINFEIGRSNPARKSSARARQA